MSKSTERITKPRKRITSPWELIAQFDITIYLWVFWKSPCPFRAFVQEIFPWTISSEKRLIDWLDRFLRCIGVVKHRLSNLSAYAAFLLAINFFKAHTCLAKTNHYEYLFFDEVIHVEVPFKQRYDCLQKITLSMPEVCLSIILFIWKVQTNSNIKEIINHKEQRL